MDHDHEQPRDHPQPHGPPPSSKRRNRRKRQLRQPPAADLPRVLSETLKEPKQALLHRVVRTIGPNHAWTLLQETLRLEKQGGQRVQAHASGAPEKFLEVVDPATQQRAPRRRSTGGVFFSLLREQVPKEMYDTIYEVENRKKKETKKRIKYQRKQVMEKTIAQLGLDDLTLDTAATARPPPTVIVATASGGHQDADDVEEGEVEDMELM